MQERVVTSLGSVRAALLFSVRRVTWVPTAGLAMKAVPQELQLLSVHLLHTEWDTR